VKVDYNMHGCDVRMDKKPSIPAILQNVK